MARIKYDMTGMKFMALFESMTRAKLKDCFIKDEAVFFIVQEGQIGLALGKRGVNIKRIEAKLNRKIKIVEFNFQVEQFIKNTVFPLQINTIEEEDGVYTLHAADSKTRGLLIGRAAQNLRRFESLIQRYYPELKELKVA